MGVQSLCTEMRGENSEQGSIKWNNGVQREREIIWLCGAVDSFSVNRLEKYKVPLIKSAKHRETKRNRGELGKQLVIVQK